MTDREIIQVLAERVMGYNTRKRGPMMQFEHEELPTLLFWDECQGTGEDRGWNPLESWADAGMLLESWSQLANTTISLRIHPNVCTCNPSHMSRTTSAATGPRAISLAAYQWALTQEAK